MHTYGADIVTNGFAARGVRHNTKCWALMRRAVSAVWTSLAGCLIDDRPAAIATRIAPVRFPWQAYPSSLEEAYAGGYFCILIRDLRRENKRLRMHLPLTCSCFSACLGFLQAVGRVTGHL